MTCTRSPILLSALLLTLGACGDDGAGRGDTTSAADTRAATDTLTSADTAAATDTLVADSGPGPTDTENASATDTGTASDTAIGELTCFDFWPDEVAAIDGAFDASSPMWRRPHDDEPVCPADGLLPESAGQVPHVVYAFCNNEGRELTFDFEMISQTGPNDEPAVDDPYLVLYRGVGIPEDARQCAAVNDDIPDAIATSDALIEGVTVQPGEAITVVGTVFQFIADDGTGAGGYLLVVAPSDL